MKFQHVFLLFCLFFLKNSLSATVWPVGPSRVHKVPSQVAPLVADGDTVEIDAGLYTGDVAKWYANNLLLRGIGPARAHLEAAGKNAEGKAIWVIKGADCRVENIEFSGCTVPDHNGAGIRQEGQNLTLRNCFFHHNEMGILTGNDGKSQYDFEGCEFAENGFGDGYSHNIYIGHVRSFSMRFCYSHDAHVGHLVKSRAELNFLYCNRLTGENGDGSYEIDLPNGGIAVVEGNIIEQSANSQNGGIISYGLEGLTNPDKAIALVQNTIWNRRFDGRFLQVSDQTLTVKMVNNLFAGPGTLLSGTPATLDTTHDLRMLDIAAAGLADPQAYNFAPLPSSICVDAGDDLGFFNNLPLSLYWQYKHPLGSELRTKNGAAWDVGAYELATASAAGEIFEAKTSVEIYPNPTPDGQLHVVFKNEIEQPMRLRVLDFSGKICREMPVPPGSQPLELTLENYPQGIYFIDIQGFGRRAVVKI